MSPLLTHSLKPEIHFKQILPYCSVCPKTCVSGFRATRQLKYNIREYLLTPWCRVLLEQLTGLQLVKKFPCISRNPKVHYRTHKRPPPFYILGQQNPVHIPTSHLLERSVLILSTHLRLGLPSGLFPSGFPTKILYTPLSSSRIRRLYKYKD